MLWVPTSRAAADFHRNHFGKEWFVCLLKTFLRKSELLVVCEVISVFFFKHDKKKRLDLMTPEVFPNAVDSVML